MPLAFEYKPLFSLETSFSSYHCQVQTMEVRHRGACCVRLDTIGCGEVVYPIRFQLTGWYFPSLGELVVDGFPSPFIGIGESHDAALDNFQLKVHARFQELVNKRNFEMSDCEREDCATLSEVIDETRYRNSEPVQVRQFGEVLYQDSPRPSAIRWDSGIIEHVGLPLIGSTDFALLEDGQSIEAVLNRDPMTGEVLSIPFFRRVSRLRTGGEFEMDWNDSIGSTSDYSDADWD